MKKDVICIAILAILKNLVKTGCLGGKKTSNDHAVRRNKQNSLIFFIVMTFLTFAAQTQVKAQDDEPMDKKLTLAVFVIGLESNQVSDFLALLIGNELSMDDRYEVITRNSAVQKKIKELRELKQSGDDMRRDELIEWGRQNNVSRLCYITAIKLDEHMLVANFIDAQNNRLIGIGDYNIVNLSSAEFKKAAESLAGQLRSNENAAKNHRKIADSPPPDVQRHPAEPEMVEVEGGTFMMGCRQGEGDCEDDESPPHKVTVSSFYISKYEITQAQWDLIMETNIQQQRDKVGPGVSLYGEGGNYPMYYVSWNEVQEFLLRLNHATGRHYRLPTEAEWEYAARGGKHSNDFKYSGSDNIYDVAWFSYNSIGQNHPVGTRKANELGIHDMSGNVWEWCLDWAADYSSSPQRDPMGASNGVYRIFRGGGWANTAVACRVTNRINSSPNSRYFSVGFRVVLP